VLTAAVGSVFTAVAVGNDLAIRDRAASSSRFGPTDPSREPPVCDDVLSAGPGAKLELSVDGDVDGRPLGTVDVSGVRSGTDFRWLAYVATSAQLGQFGAARVGPNGWALDPRTGWRSVPETDVADDGLDAQVLREALDPGKRVVAEMHGVSFFEGARARHCRIAIDGPTFRAAFPQVEWLVGDANLARWRGQLDYWVFTDGQLGRVSGTADGDASAIRDGALQGRLRVTLTATERDRDHPIVAPAG
jgi:hypothetical protein